MSFTFGATKDSIQETGTARPAFPCIAKVSLQSVEKRDVKGKDDTVYPNVLFFIWKVHKGETDIQGNDISGYIIENSEWEPREDATQEKVDNMTGRIGYIMSKYMPEEDALIDGSTITSWEHYVDTVISRFNKNPEYKEVVAKIKYVANIYNGESSLQVPKYKGFLQTAESGSALGFGPKEIKTNNQFIAMQTGAADAGVVEEEALAEEDVF